jgi:hypothetical protein
MMPEGHRAQPGGLILDGSEAPGTVRALAQAADEAGGTLWIACHLFRRDPITLAAMALAATSRLGVALMALSPYSVHPVFATMAAARYPPSPKRLKSPGPCSTGRQWPFVASVSKWLVAALPPDREIFRFCSPPLARECWNWPGNSPTAW